MSCGFAETTTTLCSQAGRRHPEYKKCEIVDTYQCGVVSRLAACFHLLWLVNSKFGTNVRPNPVHPSKTLRQGGYGGNEKVTS